MNKDTLEDIVKRRYEEAALNPARKYRSATGQFFKETVKPTAKAAWDFVVSGGIQESIDKKALKTAQKLGREKARTTDYAISGLSLPLKAGKEVLLGTASGLYQLGNTVLQNIYGDAGKKKIQEQHEKLKSKTTLGNLVPENANFQQLSDNISAKLEKNPNATNFEKKTLGPIIAVTAFAFEAYPGTSGKGNLIKNTTEELMKKVVVKELADEVKEKTIRSILTKRGFTNEIIEESLPTLMKATSKEEIESSFKKGIENALTKLSSLSDDIAEGTSREFLSPDEGTLVRSQQALNTLELPKNKILSEKELIKELNARGVSSDYIPSIKLPDGTPLNDVYKIKVNSLGEIDTVLKKSQIDGLKKYKGIPDAKYEKITLGSKTKELAKKGVVSIEIPTFFMERKGLKDILYRPVVEAFSNKEALQTEWKSLFREIGLTKGDNMFIPEYFNISTKESKNIQKYFLTRQGVADFGVTYDMLKPKEKLFADTFDKITSQKTKELAALARREGIPFELIDDYSPAYIKKDVRVKATSMEDGNLTSKERLEKMFGSFVKRKENTPKEIYELDVRKVVPRYIEDASHVLETRDAIASTRMFLESKKYLNTVNRFDREVIDGWFKNLAEVGKASDFVKIVRGARGLTALSALGLNVTVVLKQAHTLVAAALTDGVLPKAYSRYARSIGVKTRKLPAITSRTGDISNTRKGIISRTLTQTATKFDQKIAQGLLNGYIDKAYKTKFKTFKKFANAQDTETLAKEILWEAQEKVSNIAGGFLPGQKPSMYRNEFFATVAQFTFPTVSQLNTYAMNFYRAKGFGNKAASLAKIATAVSTIAYLDSVYEKMSFNWDTKEEMQKDFVINVASNLPYVGTLAYSILNKTDPSLSPLTRNLENTATGLIKEDWEKAFWSSMSTVGVPKQIQRTVEGVEVIKNEGGLSKPNKKTGKRTQTFKLDTEDPMEITRTLLRGKYGSLAGGQYVSGIGKPKSKTKKKTTTKEKDYEAIRNALK